MKQKDLDYWEDFENEIQGLEVDRAKGEGVAQGTHYLFRGQGNQDWHLETTLERKAKIPWSFSQYFRLILCAQPQIETFTKLIGRSKIGRSSIGGLQITITYELSFQRMIIWCFCATTVFQHRF